MTPTQAQRIRFGILAARHALDQVDYLENCRDLGWRKEDAWKAYRREAINFQRRRHA